MKEKIIILLIFLLFSISVGATESLLNGQWRAKTINVEKNVDGISQTSRSRTSPNIKSYIPRPEKLEIIDSSTIILYYPGGTFEKADYSIKDDQLLISAAGLIQVYQYKLNNKQLILSITHKYDYNQPSGKLEHIEEKWVITFAR